jgi:hypothetical protein
MCVSDVCVGDDKRRRRSRSKEGWVGLGLKFNPRVMVMAKWQSPIFVVNPSGCLFFFDSYSFEKAVRRENDDDEKRHHSCQGVVAYASR